MENAKRPDTVPQSMKVNHCSSVTSNGCALNASTPHEDVEDDDFERTGVFDYMPLKSLPKEQGSLCHVLNGRGSDDQAEEAIDHKWARELAYNSNVECLNDKELTTFHCSTGPTRAYSGDYLTKLGAVNGGNVPGASSEQDESLEEIVVQTEVVPQRVTYQRFNADSRALRYVPATSNTDPVYITNIQRSSEERNSYWANCSDEREVVERRSALNSQYANSSGERYFKVTDADQDDCTSATSGHEESPTSVANDDLSSMHAIPRPFGSNILYLNDLWSPRTQSSITSSGDTDDGSSSRYYSGGNTSGGPRSDTFRRLIRKLQKRKTDQPTSTGADISSGPSTSLAAAPVSRSQDVAEYKGDLPFDEVLAYINDMKTEETRRSRSKASSSTILSAVPAVKENSKTSVRKKKKHCQNITESSASYVNGSHSVSSKQDVSDDKSVFSGSEALDRISLDAAEEVLQRHDASEIGRLSISLTSSVVDDFGCSNEPDQFVVVQKKKKNKNISLPSGLNKTSEFDNWRKYKNPAPSYTPHTVNVRPVDLHASNNVRRSVDLELASASSGSESTSCSVHERVVANEIQLSGTDFPNLGFDHLSSTRQNSKRDQEQVDKSVPQSITTSYAVVAAAGLTFAPGDQQRRKSLELTANQNHESNPPVKSFLGISEASAAKDHPSSTVFTATASSGHTVFPTISVDIVNNANTCTLSRISEQNSVQLVTPKPANNMAAARSGPIVASEIEDRMSVAERSNTADDYEPQAVAESSLRAALTTEKKTLGGTPVPPVVFMDVGGESGGHLSTSVGELTFGFDSNDLQISGVPPVMSDRITSQTECALPTCARCAGVTSAERAPSTSVATSTDCATSPIEQQDFMCSPHSVRKTSVVGWATSSHLVCGYCRPINPLSASHPASHPPIGIVPPIPHVDRTQITETIDYGDSKMLTSVEQIMSSMVVANQKSTLLSCESRYIDDSIPIPASEKPLLVKQDQPVSCISAVSESAADGTKLGSFCLLSAQIFLYKVKTGKKVESTCFSLNVEQGFEDTLAERNLNPNSVVQYTWNE